MKTSHTYINQELSSGQSKSYEVQIQCINIIQKLHWHYFQLFSTWGTQTDGVISNREIALSTTPSIGVPMHSTQSNAYNFSKFPMYGSFQFPANCALLTSLFSIGKKEFFTASKYIKYIITLILVRSAWLIIASK